MVTILEKFKKAKTQPKGLRYDYFNFWRAMLLNALTIESKEKELLIKRIESALNKELRKLTSELDTETPEDRIEYITAKRHIRYPEFKKNCKLQDTEVYCKIRINPCLASEKDEGEHTKIWVIFYNKEASDLSLEKMLLLFKKLSEITEYVFNHIHEILEEVLGKVAIKSENYKITMINASVHFDMIEEMDDVDKACLKTTEASKILEIKDKSDIGFNLINDIEKLISNKIVSGTPKRLFAFSKKKKAWKHSTSRYYDTIARIKATDSNITSAQIAIINKATQRHKMLYRDPHFEAVDLSRQL